MSIQDKIDAVTEASQGDNFRDHLGASVLCQSCPRAIWYSFRWAKKIHHSARLLRLFERGHLEEKRFVKRLRAAGFKVWEVDPDTGEQYTISALRGHFGGATDGIVLIDGVYYLLEFKTHADKYFKQLVKKGLKVAFYKHYVQMQLYMYFGGLTHGLYQAVNKNDDDIYEETIELDKAVVKKYMQRAEFIINSDEAPERISDDPKWHECKGYKDEGKSICDYYFICHRDELPAVNCRTCAHSSTGDNGAWTCSIGYIAADPNMGCYRHLYNPHMLNFELIEAAEKDGAFFITIKIDGNKFTFSRSEELINEKS
jgi:hypothetical protein